MIREIKLTIRPVALLAAAITCVFGQEPSPGPVSPARPASVGSANAAGSVNAAAIAGSKQDAAAVDRGGKAFGTYCAGCHGVAAKGGPGAPDLVRSVLVLDDEKGILIGPVIREGRPDKGMPKFNLTEPQISDIVAWLHVRTYSAGHRGTYTFQDVVTGDPKKGAAYFQTTGGCSSCHSVTGDLAGVGRKYDAFSLQSRWLQPRSSRRTGPGNATESASKLLPSVTVTTSSGELVSGTLDHINDFVVSLRDAKGQFHSFAREGSVPKVVISDPLHGHTALLGKYTDTDIHNVTAYLVTLK